MGDDREIDGTILRLDLIEPDFRIFVGIPARRDVLRTAGRRYEDAVDPKRLCILGGFDRFVGRDSPRSGDDRNLAVSLFHRDLQNSALLLSCEIENLARLGIDAQAAIAQEPRLFEEILKEASVRRFVNLKSIVVRLV